VFQCFSKVDFLGKNNHNHVKLLGQQQHYLLSHSMFSSIEGFGDQAFVSLVILALVVAAANVGTGRFKTIELAVFMTASLLVGIQYFYVVKVATYIPASKHWVFDVSRYQVSAFH
jgi:hypothetical protein